MVVGGVTTLEAVLRGGAIMSKDGARGVWAAIEWEWLSS